MPVANAQRRAGEMADPKETTGDMGELCACLLGMVVAVQGVGATPVPASRPASRPASQPASRPGSAVVRVESAAPPPSSRPASMPAAKLAPLLAKADGDPNFVVDGLERTIVALGRAVATELDRELRARAETPMGPPLARAYGKISAEGAI